MAKKKIDPEDPTTWPDSYHGCGVCDKFGSTDLQEVLRHIKRDHPNAGRPKRK